MARTPITTRNAITIVFYFTTSSVNYVFIKCHLNYNENEVPNQYLNYYLV
jgi:hypothetical protein